MPSHRAAALQPVAPGAQDDVFPHRPPHGRSRLFNNSVVGAVVGGEFDRIGLDAEYWRPSVTDYYRFALTPPQVDGLLCAPQTPAEIEALARALEEGPLDDEDVNYLINLSALAHGRVSLDRAES